MPFGGNVTPHRQPPRERKWRPRFAQITSPTRSDSRHQTEENNVGLFRTLSILPPSSLASLLGGTLSGEHGIGLTKLEFLPLEVAPVELALMRSIKKLLDPNNILNPGKIFSS